MGVLPHYKELYNYSQSLDIPVSRKLLLPKVCELTGRNPPKIRFDRLDTKLLRGFFLSANAFARQANLPLSNDPVDLIVVGDDQSKCWQRFVVVKELTHMLDDPHEFCGTPDDFQTLLGEFTGAPLVERSPAGDSDVRSIYMALGLLCPEEIRAEFEQRYASFAMSHVDIAEKLKIPLYFVPTLFTPDYLKIIRKLTA